jgi:hypothetical protein
VQLGASEEVCKQNSVTLRLVSALHATGTVSAAGEMLCGIVNIPKLLATLCKCYSETGSCMEV